MGKAVAYCADKDGVKTIGFEQDHLTFEKWNSMQAELSAEMVPTLNVIEGFRAIKTPEEIKNLTVACDIASRAFEKIIKDIRPGVTEKEIASRLAHYMVMEGADTKPYGGIVISGAKSSLLHGIPDSKANRIRRFRIDGLWMPVQRLSFRYDKNSSCRQGRRQTERSL